MPAHTHYLWFETKRRQEVIDITDDVAAQVRSSGIREGFVLVSAMHISASVFVNDHDRGCGMTSCIGWSTRSPRGTPSDTGTTTQERTMRPPTCGASLSGTR
jgi:hypothetical protein